MAIAAKPKRRQTDSAAPDPMEFIHGAESQQQVPEVQAASQPAKRPRKEPVIIRFDETTLTRIDQAASKRGLSRAALVRMLVIENLPD
jgi:hypothetical protein